MRNNTPVIVGAIAVVALVVAGLWLVSGNSRGSSGLTDVNWQLSAITEQTPTFQGVVPAAEQPNYAIRFNDDGTYTGRADCNAIAGTYTTGRNNGITIEPGASTLIACPATPTGRCSRTRSRRRRRMPSRTAISRSPTTTARR